jgi:hypothetical protein
MLPSGRMVTYALPSQGRVADRPGEVLPWRWTSPPAPLLVGEGSQITSDQPALARQIGRLGAIGRVQLHQDV